MLPRKSSRPFKDSTPQAQRWSSSRSPKQPKQGRRPDGGAGEKNDRAPDGSTHKQEQPPVTGARG